MFYDDNPCAGAEREIDNYIADLNDAERRVRALRKALESIERATEALPIVGEMARIIQVREIHKIVTEALSSDNEGR